MGLSGRKTKQRIPDDPRNLSWADNAAKFGQTYLSKFGWDASQGLGAAGEGRTSALQVQQKLDMLGIGMQHQRDANGIAWKQNRDFESLLRRLNGGVQEEGEGGTKVEGFNRAREGEEEEGEEKEKKKKRKGDGEDGGERKEKKKRKKTKDGEARAESPAAEPAAAAVVSPTPVRAPPRAHRARHIAHKRMAARNPAALSEILGIPSSSVPSTPTAQPTPAPTPTLTAIEEGLVKQTTASQSVADYFKMKLLAKSGGGSGSVTPDGEGERRGLGAFRLRYAEEGDEDEEERPRMGLGAGSAFAGMFASASVKEVVSVDAEETPEARDEDAKRERKAAKDERRRAKDERRRLRAEAKAKALAEAADEVPATSLAPAVVEVEAKRGAGKTKTAGGDAEIAGENKSGRKRRKAVE